MRKRADEVARSETDGVETFHWSPRILTVDGTKIEQLLAQNALAHPEQGAPQQRPEPAGTLLVPRSAPPPQRPETCRSVPRTAGRPNPDPAGAGRCPDHVLRSVGASLSTKLRWTLGRSHVRDMSARNIRPRTLRCELWSAGHRHVVVEAPGGGGPHGTAGPIGGARDAGAARVQCPWSAAETSERKRPRRRGPEHGLLGKGVHGSSCRSPQYGHARAPVWLR
jgi:hypothetical protein